MTEPPYPSLRIRFQISSFQGETLALVDTGFDGHFTVPESLVDTLPPPRHVRRVRLAGGQVLYVPTYLGALQLVLQPRLITAVIIALGDEYLVGLATINHFRLTFDHGHRLILEP